MRVQRQRPGEPIPGGTQMFGRHSLVPARPALEIQIHRIRMRRARRALRLGLDQLAIQSIRQTRNDFILNVEEVGERFIKAIRPQVLAAFGINQLRIDAQAVATALHRPFEGVANVQFAADSEYIG